MSQRPSDNAPAGSGAIVVTPPDWIDEVVDWDRPYPTDADRMRLAIRLAEENVRRGSGGPFGAAVFAGPGGVLAGVGVNSVERLRSSSLHAEILALMDAQARARSFSLAAPALPAHELFTSCEPCAMCLGATLWSGVRRLVSGASRRDAAGIGFDEGPVFPASYEYLESRGVRVDRGVLRAEAVPVLRRYAAAGGLVYNP